jgi:hypothetical protein
MDRVFRASQETLLLLQSPPSGRRLRVNVRLAPPVGSGEDCLQVVVVLLLMGSNLWSWQRGAVTVVLRNVLTTVVRMSS